RYGRGQFACRLGLRGRTKDGSCRAQQDFARRRIACNWRFRESTDCRNPAPAGQRLRSELFFATPVICRFGLSEYCDRIDTEITSKPTGATVYFDGQSSGTTEIRALLRSTDVKSLRIELAEYKPCRFEDGTYQGGNGDSYATFNCELKSLR